MQPDVCLWQRRRRSHFGVLPRPRRRHAPRRRRTAGVRHRNRASMRHLQRGVRTRPKRIRHIPLPCGISRIRRKRQSVNGQAEQRRGRLHVADPVQCRGGTGRQNRRVVRIARPKTSAGPPVENRSRRMRQTRWRRPEYTSSQRRDSNLRGIRKQPDHGQGLSGHGQIRAAWNHQQHGRRHQNGHGSRCRLVAHAFGRDDARVRWIVLHGGRRPA